MARWKLTEPHYLNVPGTKWELSQNDRTTGRPVRKVFPVPLFLHPDSPDDWTHDKRDDGYIVVCHEGRGNPEDIVFVGEPTPGMLPLDEEAQQLSAKYSHKWTPTAGTDEQSQMESFQQKLLNGLADQMSAVQASAAAAPAAAGMEKFMEMMVAMMQQNQQILQALAGKSVDAEFEKQAKALGETRSEPETEPLDSAEPSAEEVAAAAQASAAAEAESRQRAEAHARRGRR